MFFTDKQLTTATRLALKVLVDHEDRRCGKRVVAYQNIGDLLGISASWIQKFLRDEIHTPSETSFQTIHRHYCDLCLRIEQENEADELRLQELKVQIDALACRANAQGDAEAAPVPGKARVK